MNYLVALVPSVGTTIGSPGREAISQVLPGLPSGAWGLVTGAVAAVFSFLGLLVTALVAIRTNASTARLALITETDDRFDKAIQSLYATEARIRSGSAYILASMALHGTEREERYFATTLTSLCNVVRFDRDINFIDAAFTELFVLYREATPTERANLRALKVATKKALALHLAEYQVAVGQPDNLHWEAIFAVTPGAEAFMKTGDFAGEDFNDGDFQKRFASELLFAKLIRTFDAALHAEEPLESSLSEEALEELKARRDELKDKAWSIRIDGLLLSHISRILDNS